LIPVANRYRPEFTVLEMGEVSAAGVAQALENVYRDPMRSRQLTATGFTATQNPHYSWDAVAGRFEKLFVEFGQARP
jgi:hypothetical protein